METLFEALRESGADHVRTADLTGALEVAGLSPDDLRVRPALEALDQLRQQHPETAERLDLTHFRQVVQGSTQLIERAVQRDFVIPDFAGFSGELGNIFAEARQDRDGNIATYIPQLARVDPELYGMGVCTVDGQRFGIGDAAERFCLQSTCKPVNYLLALADEGAETVHRHIGREPSGRSYNELSLNHEGLPHNPMINSGAIMACSLIGRELGPADRFDHVRKMWTRMTGGVEPGFDNAVYLSERRTGDRNFALGYFMREHKAFPEGTDLTATLEFYFQCCSLELDVQQFSVVAATLANGGICPLTEQRVVSPDAIQKCLSLMYSCGMYDFSGEWAFSVGLPAKSGVSGIILVVVPNTLGLAVWSPRLDRHGNSVRGIRVCRELVRRFNFHHYDNLVEDLGGKRDPRRREGLERGALLGQLLWAASQGDVVGMQRIAARGVDLGSSDYDGRTPLHLAASEGHADAVAFLLDRGVPARPLDRWGGTPHSDAKRHGHGDVLARLEAGTTP